MVFPSLRVHEPNPAGLEVHPDLAGYRVSPTAFFQNAILRDAKKLRKLKKRRKC
jgi:hypothetical protein